MWPVQAGVSHVSYGAGGGAGTQGATVYVHSHGQAAKKRYMPITTIFSSYLFNKSPLH